MLPPNLRLIIALGTAHPLMVDTASVLNGSSLGCVPATQSETVVCIPVSPVVAHLDMVYDFRHIRIFTNLIRYQSHLLSLCCP